MLDMGTQVKTDLPKLFTGDCNPDYKLVDVTDGTAKNLPNFI